MHRTRSSAKGGASNGKGPLYGPGKRGDELPVELANRAARSAAMAAARASMEEEAADKARKAAEEKARDRGDDDQGTSARGEAAAKAAEPKPTAQCNFTDPDARTMKTADGSYHYCYDGQAVVDADHQVIIATVLNNTANIAALAMNLAERAAGPDFWSIGRFRQRHLAALTNVFLQALELCQAAGLVSLGKVDLQATDPGR